MNLLTVNIVTYNHEEYIEQCVRSVIDQITDFEFVIKITDDHSTDSTAKLLSELKTEFPDKIQLHLNDRNKGMVVNIIESLSTIDTEFVAILEGDDFFIDKNKLQLQINALMSDPSLSFCYTNGTVVASDKESRTFYPKDYFNSNILTLDSFIRNDYQILNTSKVYRSESLPARFPDWYYKTHLWDWILHFFQLEKGNAIYLDINGTGFRTHERSFIASLNKKQNLENGLVVLNYLNQRYKNAYKNVLGTPWKLYSDLAIQHYKLNEKGEFVNYCWKAIKTNPKAFISNLRDFIYLLRN